MIKRKKFNDFHKISCVTFTSVIIQGYLIINDGKFALH